MKNFKNVGTALAVAAVFVCGVSIAHAGDLIDTFFISVGDTVSEGVPGPGAGHLEKPGSMDIYYFNIDREIVVFFEEISGPCQIRWRCLDPNGEEVFLDFNLCTSHPGSHTLSLPGEYTIEVFSINNTTGVYSFKLWDVPAPDEFEITLDQHVSPGDPGPGAGEIEQPGSIDIYTMYIDEPITVYFDEISGPCDIRWRCEAPDGTVLFNNNTMCTGDPGVYELDLPGAYTISVYGLGNAFGTYEFKVWSVPPADEFTIGLDQVVALDDPGPGAGHIEQPGAIDIYYLPISNPILVYFNEINGPCHLRWRCEAPDGTVLFNNNALCTGDPGEFLLDQIGEYVITAYSTGSGIGTYSFELVTVEDVQEFTIELELVVSDGVPARGAGNIEEPGSVDQYTLHVTEPTLVYFQELAGSCSINWMCEKPDGSLLFTDSAICTGHPGLHMLDQTGAYTIRVAGNQDGTGTYSFTIWDVGEPDEFDINIGDVIAEGVPGEGAGYIEKPGRKDIYYLTVNEPTPICIEQLAGNCTFRWTVTGPNDLLLLDSAIVCGNNKRGLVLPVAGEYAITAHAANAQVGPYSFTINPGTFADLDGNCIVNVADMLILLSQWGACPPEEACPADLNGDGVVNTSDLLFLLSQWG